MDFPWWLRAEHFLNIIFITFFIRSGIEILGTYPKLYRSQHTKPGTSWARFTVREQPKHKNFTVGGEYEDYSPIVSLPGKGLLGIGRYWHFMTAVGFTVCTIAYIVTLFATGYWRRYVPTSLDVFGQAGKDLITYLSLQIPHPVGDVPFNALQQLTYGSVILILGPFMIFTGLMQSPAIANHFHRLTAALGGRQVIRSAHWCGLAAYVLFIIGHVFMVIIHGYGHEVSKMVFGDTASPEAAAVIFTMGLVFVVVLHIIATKTSLDNPRFIERIHNVIVRPVSSRLLKLESRSDMSNHELTENFRSSGRPPEADEYKAMLAHGFEQDYLLEIGGLVERPMTLSMADLREICAGHSQTTLHHCVQGFTSVGKWTGIPVSVLLDLVKPLPGASDVVYMCFQSMGRDDPLYEGGHYYDSTPMLEARQPQTLIAIGLNDGPIPVDNGAPVRLRLETSCGFRSAKWVDRIEVVNRYDIIGEGRGGFFEDLDFYDRLQTI